MIYIFYGSDRLSAEKEAKKILGEDYEVVDGENLEPRDLPDLFQGVTLFEENRRILIKDLLSTKALAEEIPKYLETPHKIVLFEQSLDGRTATIKDLKKDKRVEMKEFKLPEAKEDRFLAFNLYDLALRDGKKAAEKLRSVENTEVPYAMVGAWGSKAITRFLERPNDRHRKNAVKELARIDLLLKSAKVAEDPWPILELFLLRLKDL